MQVLTTLKRLHQRRQDVDCEGGFTLIELLMVIVILGILAAIVVFAVQDMTASSAQAACATDLKTTETAVLAYKAQMSNYPNGIQPNGSVIGIQTDNDATTMDAASALSGPGSELLTGSEMGSSGKDSNGHTTPNVALNPIGGAWLKDMPSNPGHYYIWVTNDGTGDLFVGSGTLTPTSTEPVATNCSAIS